MTVSDNTIAAEKLANFSLSECKKGLKSSENKARKVFKNRRRAFEIGANVFEIPMGAVVHVIKF